MPGSELTRGGGAAPGKGEGGTYTAQTEGVGGENTTDPEGEPSTGPRGDPRGEGGARAGAAWLRQCLGVGQHALRRHHLDGDRARSIGKGQ